VNDSITSIYCDYNFPLTNFVFTFPSTTMRSGTGGHPNAALPENILAPGLNVGTCCSSSSALQGLALEPGNQRRSNRASWPKSPVSQAMLKSILRARML